MAGSTSRSIRGAARRERRGPSSRCGNTMDMLRFLTASALVVLSMTVATAQTDYLARARALHRQSLLIDGHNDYPWALREHDAARSLDTPDISKPQPSLLTHTRRAKRGGTRE